MKKIIAVTAFSGQSACHAPGPPPNLLFGHSYFDRFFRAAVLPLLERALFFFNREQFIAHAGPQSFTNGYESFRN
ncbi:MAG: hypothetical protein LBK61_13895 [Spirochaetaceae bacterium]|nr:hypothetical protein [Spirochaetaceae bacterium]